VRESDKEKTPENKPWDLSN